ncbi:MAG: hypothetical protein ACREME_12245 [Gemmatimonadales bacterium]
MAAVLAVQQAASPLPGTRVRITAPQAGLRQAIGTLLEPHGDTLALRRILPRVQLGRYVQDTTVSLVPMTTITRLEVSRGQRGHGGQGFLVGAFLGGALGFIAFESCPETGSFAPAPCGKDTGAALGAGFGGVLGFIVGTLIRTERWQVQ